MNIFNIFIYIYIKEKGDVDLEEQNNKEDNYKNVCVEYCFI